jgi:hypothetical protein
LAVLLLLSLVSVLCVACSRGDGRRAGESASATTSSPSAAGATPSSSSAPAEPTTTVPRVTPPVTGPGRVTPAVAQPASGSCPAVPAREAPRGDRSVYKLAIDVQPDDGVVTGTETVTFTPDRDTDRIVFRLWANSPRIAGAGGKIEAALEDGSPTQQPNPTTLVVPGAVKAGQTKRLSLTWTLTLPTSVTNDRVSRTGSAIRLGSFFPILAWHPGLGWATEPPTSGFAESSLTVPSDFDVTMKVPDGLTVLASGAPDGPGHWVASGMGDWAASIGDFRIVTGTADGGGVQVPVTVGVDRQVGDAPGPYLDKAIKAIADFGERFGTYPWPEYTLALTPNLAGGIEYPGHVMQGPGTLGRTTSHEIGHQWFYALVPTNQGATPWIDEGLASYAEARFEGSLGSFEGREIPAGGAGHAGEPMTYWESRQSIYYRSVYVQGAVAVAALGPADQVDCALRQLVARQAYRVTGNADVIAALSTVFPTADAVLARYGIYG